jgi:hypothetical protein
MTRDFRATYSDLTRCPRCAARIRMEDILVLVPGNPNARCRTCGHFARVSITYRRVIWFITLALAWSIPYFVGLAHYVLIAWIPFFLLASLLVPHLAKSVAPPKLEDFSSPERRTIFRRNLELFITIWVYCAFSILLNGSFARVVSGKEALFQYLSAPPGWFDKTFVVRSETGPLWTLVLFLINTIVYPVILFPLYFAFRIVSKAVHRRTDPIRLGLNNSEIDGADDDDDA